MKTLIARKGGASAAFATFSLALAFVCLCVFAPVAGAIVLALALAIFAPEVAKSGRLLLEAAGSREARAIVGVAGLAAIAALGLALGVGSAFAANAAAPAASTTVSIPWGDWTAALLSHADSIVMIVLGALGSRTGVPAVKALVTSSAVSGGVHYVLATEAGLAAGKTIEVNAGSALVATIANWLTASAPLAARWAGANLEPLIVAELSKAGVLPAGSSAATLGVAAAG